MNRLLGTKVYLIGSMDRVADGGEGWRTKITPFLQEKGIFVLNPCDKPIADATDEAAGRMTINQLKADGRYDEIRPMFGEKIRGLDLRMVDESSFLICFLDMDTYPCGTWEELFTANKSKKPILVVNKQGKVNAPNWLFLTLPHQFIFDSFEQLKTYITHVDSHEGEVETYKRWRFFDWSKLVSATINLCPEKFGIY